MINTNIRDDYSLEVYDELEFPNLKFVIHYKFVRHYYLSDAEREVIFWKVIQNVSQATYSKHDGVRIRLDEIIRDCPNFENLIDTKYNCHGYTLTDKEFYIRDQFAAIIFEDEYEECLLSECEILLFFIDDELIHSGKFHNDDIKTLTHKMGINQFIESDSFDNVFSQYPKTTKIVFVKKKLNI